jgi:hypothetical protein
MKKTILSCLAALVLFSVPFTVIAAKEVKVEVLYMNHGPLLSTLNDIKALFAKYGGKIAVSWHDVDTQDGEKFMAQKKLKGHIPLVIWMDDYVKLQIDGKEIVFAGFPTGKGPYFFQGKWTMEDLRKALDQVTTKK